jgi:hypothetical protein
MDFYNEKGQRIGELEWYRGEQWLVKYVKTDKHMIRKPYGAWATDAGHLALLREAGAVGIILVVDGKRAMTARVSIIEERGFRLNRGHGDQIGLMGREWETLQGATPERAEVSPAPPPGIQGAFDL